MAGQLPDGDSQRVFTEALCAIDGGEGSFAAIEQAAKLVGPGGSLTVLIVTKLRTGIGQMPVDSATELVDRANELADRAGVSCRIEVDPAGPVHQIVSEWASVHDLLAIGAPPKSLLAGILFSGVTDTAIRSLSTPLLIARPVRAAADFGERMLVASDGLRGSDELVAFASRVARDGRSALTLIPRARAAFHRAPLPHRRAGAEHPARRHRRQRRRSRRHRVRQRTGMFGCRGHCMQLTKGACSSLKARAATQRRLRRTRCPL